MPQDAFVNNSTSDDYKIGLLDSEVLQQSSRAWGTFQGWQTEAILATGVGNGVNFSGVVKNSPGNYTVNFASALATSGYVVMVSEMITSGTFNQCATWANVTNQAPAFFTIVVNSGIPAKPADTCTVNFSVLSSL